MLTSERLHEVATYDHKTGNFIWNKYLNSHAQPGRIAGTNHQGYIRIAIDKRQYLAHRLAWLYVFGHWPTKHLDHIDGNRQNNRITNLREATISQNKANERLRKDSTSMHKGVGRMGKHWMARISKNGIRYYLGTFKSKNAAITAYSDAAQKLHGEFARTR